MLYFFNNLFSKVFDQGAELCPACGCEFERIHRTTSDRLLCILSGLKLRRFACPKCEREYLLLVTRNR
jgi:hypothetical protein